MIKKSLSTFFVFFLLAGFALAQTNDQNDPIITLERDPGYWGWAGDSPCPFYKLMIFADGRVLLEPKDIIEHKAVAGKTIESRIAPSKVAELISEFDMSGFSFLKSTSENGNKGFDPKDCPNKRTDNGTFVISIRSGTTITRVEHYDGCFGTENLKTLTRLEDKIDETVNIKQWIDCRNGKNRIDLSKPAGKN